MTLTETDFDYIVIGSSPLLLMAALERSRSGAKVAVVESAPHLGGAWHVCETKIDGNHHVVTECACHLIEWYRGGYEQLERMSGHSFVPLRPQPVKVFESGRRVRYTSRLGILHDLFRLCRALTALCVRVLQRWAQRDLQEMRRKIRELSRCRKDLAFFLRYKLPGVISFQHVRGPKGGYSAFIVSLQGELVKAGVVVLHRRISGVRGSETDGHVVTLKEGGELKAKRIMFGESSNFRIFCTKAAQKRAIYQSYAHLLVSVTSRHIVYKNDYIHLPDNRLFHRVTLIGEETLGPKTLFLVQLRTRCEEIEYIASKLEGLFVKIGVTNSEGRIEIVEVFVDDYLPHSDHSQWREFSRPGMIKLRTIGDLSRNVLIYKEKISRRAENDALLESNA